MSPRSLFRNVALKLLSIALAVLLWLVIAGDPIVERTLRVPLEFQNIPEQLELVGEPLGSVDVRVRGPSGEVSRLDTGDVMALLDLQGAKPGRRLLHLLPENVQAPFGISVTQVLPATVPVTLERSGARIVPVVPTVEGEPAPGYVVGGVSADPATVEVIGPESHLRQLTEAMTEPVSVADERETVRETVTVGVPDPSLRLRQPQRAVVSVAIQPAPVERTVRGVPVRAQHLLPRLTARVTPSTVAVTLRGSREVMDALVPESLIAFVDVAGLGAGRYNLPVQVEPSDRLGASRIEPATVEVRIR